jgi:hypothetical protein
VVAAHWVSDFPRQLIGPEAIHRVLAAGDDAEAEALICNPSVSDKLLEELYGRTGAFATLDEERWRKLVYLSRKNERLVTKEDTDDMPDMEHYRIHHAIFRLLEIAPVHNHWLHVLAQRGVNKGARGSTERGLQSPPPLARQTIRWIGSGNLRADPLQLYAHGP